MLLTKFKLSAVYIIIVIIFGWTPRSARVRTPYWRHVTNSGNSREIVCAAFRTGETKWRNSPKYLDLRSQKLAFTQVEGRHERKNNVNNVLGLISKHKP